MFAIDADGVGGPEVLHWRELPDPTIGPREVLVEVAATAVNRADLLQRQGLYPPPPGASKILGLECSGTIKEVSADVTTFQVGDQITALLAGGAYAERVAVPVEQLMPVPAGIDLETAGALPEVACTVWSNLVMTAGVKPGEWVLIHGGCSGIGTMAIQVARALGAHVAVTVGSEKKAAAARDLGAEVAINYHQEDFVDRIAEVTSGRGVDVILDNMGAAYLQRNVAALARNGRLLIIGMQGGVTGEFDIATALRKNASILPSSLRGRPLAEKASVCQQVAEHLWPLISAGTVRPVIADRFPLPEAAKAHARLDAGGVTGKLLLTAVNTDVG
ncbi:MAG: NAD(P)H-quinone oxidoreductase [Actinomycetales bacterium]|nr:NAD(P)H-quinone oxidoreductase [Actinomycetales bacterium]